MTVRLATPADAEPLAALAAVTFPLACPPDLPREDVDAFIETQLSAERFAAYLADEERILVVEEGPDGGLGGYTMAVLGEPYAADVAACIRIRPSSELSKIYVLPDRQGSGGARALLDRTLDEAAARGAAGMWLGTNVANARAQRFYAKAAFEQVGTRRFQVGARFEQDVVMERALSAPAP